MTRVYFILFVFLLRTVTVSGQFEMPRLESGVSPISNFKLAAVSSLLKKSNVIVMYRTYSGWGSTPFDIISWEDDNQWHAYYLSDSSKSHGVIRYDFLDSVKAPQEFIKSLWNVLVDQNAFQLPPDKKGDTACNFRVVDAADYEITILTKKEVKVLDYYAPSFFESHCSANINRQRMLRIVDVFRKANFSSLKG